MKAVFRINRLGAQERSADFDEFLDYNTLKDMAYNILKRQDPSITKDECIFDVEWVEERNTGRLLIFETEETINYITCSPNGLIRGRNSSIQSVATAYAIYLDVGTKTDKEAHFCFYFLEHTGNLATDYLMFFYKLMKNIGIEFLNLDKGIGNTVLKPFESAKEIINSRNDIGLTNSGNNSTYITDEGYCYNIYGKTFGANQKETALLCLAIASVSDKPISLYQIFDNTAAELSKNDIAAIKKYVEINNCNSFDVVGDTYEFEKEELEKEDGNLRHIRFKYNLLEKYGQKRCILCDCEIESIIEAAHIYPVKTIKHLDNVDFDKKLLMANDKENGIWLCLNHHKLFDSDVIAFEDGIMETDEELRIRDTDYINRITLYKKIKDEYLTERMLAFFDLRYGKTPRIKIDY